MGISLVIKAHKNFFSRVVDFFNKKGRFMETIELPYYYKIFHYKINAICTSPHSPSNKPNAYIPTFSELMPTGSLMNKTQPPYVLTFEIKTDLCVKHFPCRAHQNMYNKTDRRVTRLTLAADALFIDIKLDVMIASCCSFITFCARK